MKYISLINIALLLIFGAIIYLGFLLYKNPALNTFTTAKPSADDRTLVIETPAPKITTAPIRSGPAPTANPFGAVVRPSLDVSIRLFTANRAVTAGKDFELDALLETGSLQKNGGHVFIRFNPQMLQVEDQIPAQPGIQVLKYKDYDDIQTRSADNAAGVIEIDVRTKNRGASVSSNIFGVIKMRPVQSGQTTISIDPQSTIYFLDPSANPAIKTDTLSLAIN